MMPPGNCSELPTHKVWQPNCASAQAEAHDVTQGLSASLTLKVAGCASAEMLHIHASIKCLLRMVPQPRARITYLSLRSARLTPPHASSACKSTTSTRGPWAHRTFPHRVYNKSTPNTTWRLAQQRVTRHLSERHANAPTAVHTGLG
jgi:hypothetical protein